MQFNFAVVSASRLETRDSQHGTWRCAVLPSYFFFSSSQIAPAAMPPFDFDGKSSRRELIIRLQQHEDLFMFSTK